MLFASSGIAIECDVNVSRFLTSASLVIALNNEEKGLANVKVGPTNHHECCFFNLRYY